MQSAKRVFVGASCVLGISKNNALSKRTSPYFSQAIQGAIGVLAGYLTYRVGRIAQTRWTCMTSLVLSAIDLADSCVSYPLLAAPYARGKKGQPNTLLGCLAIKFPLRSLVCVSSWLSASKVVGLYGKLAFLMIPGIVVSTDAVYVWKYRAQIK